jgi:hypothetical protein
MRASVFGPSKACSASTLYNKAREHVFHVRKPSVSVNAFGTKEDASSSINTRIQHGQIKSSKPQRQTKILKALCTSLFVCDYLCILYAQLCVSPVYGWAHFFHNFPIPIPKILKPDTLDHYFDLFEY